MGGVCSRKNKLSCVRPTMQPLNPKRKIDKNNKDWDAQKIMQTVPHNRKHEFKDFIKRGVLHTNGTGQNLLMMYVWYAEPPLEDVTKYLITSVGISPAHVDHTGWSALHYAASNPFASLETLELLTCMAGQVSKDGQNALMMHLQYSNTKIHSKKVRLLISSGCDLKILDPFYYFEIEAEVMPGLIADRLLAIKLLDLRKRMGAANKISSVPSGVFREVIKYL